MRCLYVINKCDTIGLDEVDKCASCRVCFVGSIS